MNDPLNTFRTYALPLSRSDDSSVSGEDSATIQATSDVVDALRDHVLFTDALGRVLQANHKAQVFYGQEARPGRPFWEVLGLEPTGNDAHDTSNDTLGTSTDTIAHSRTTDLMRVLRRWPPDQVHEVSTARGDATWSLRIVQLPEDADTLGFVILATDNQPIVDLHEGMEEQKSREVQGMNLALQNVVRSADESGRMARRELVEEIRRDLLPVLERMAREPSPELRNSYLDMLRDRMNGLADADQGCLSSLLLRLTPRELEVCRLIRTGRASKSIADLLNTSFETIQTHRKNIRRKLGLRGRSISLASFLQGQPGLD